METAVEEEGVAEWEGVGAEDEEEANGLGMWWWCFGGGSLYAGRRSVILLLDLCLWLDL